MEPNLNLELNKEMEREGEMTQQNKDVEKLYGNKVQLCCWAVCRRAGGGFGGKVTRSMPIAAAAAVAAHKTGRAVHYQQDRNEDFRINGGTPGPLSPIKLRDALQKAPHCLCTEEDQQSWEPQKRSRICCISGGGGVEV